MRSIILLNFISNFLISIILCKTKYILAFNNFRGIPYKYNSIKLLSRKRNLPVEPTEESEYVCPKPVGTKVFRQGVVVECRPNTNFLVEINDSKLKLPCTLSGALYSRKVRIWNRSKVCVEVDLLSPDRGRIIERIDK